MKQRVSRRHVRINNAIKWHTIIKTQQGAMRNIGTICFVHNTTTPLFGVGKQGRRFKTDSLSGYTKFWKRDGFRLCLLLRLGGMF